MSDIQEVLLQPYGRDNICDIFPYSNDYWPMELPESEVDAEHWLASLARLRDEHMGDDFIAYDSTVPDRLVGGGDLRVHSGNTLALGVWVVAAYRRQGYGKAITHALEGHAAQDFPPKTVELHISPHNKASLALAAAIDYEFVRSDEGLMVHRKRHATVQSI
jgi:RimJ/RimL family protein N-acetyltransferase